MEPNNTIIVNSNPVNQIAITKFETCSFRSKNKITKVSCCSANNVSGFKCNLRNIFPLSYTAHCEKCDKYQT